MIFVSFLLLLKGLSIYLSGLLYFFVITESFLRCESNAEPSTLTCRTFAIATPNLRRFDAEPSGNLLNLKIASASPQKHCIKSIHLSHYRHFDSTQTPFRQHSNAIGTVLLQLWDSTHATMGRHSCNYGTVLSCKTKERNTAALCCKKKTWYDFIKE